MANPTLFLEPVTGDFTRCESKERVSMIRSTRLPVSSTRELDKPGRGSDSALIRHTTSLVLAATTIARP